LRLPFRRLLRLAGSRWRYSFPPPHGLLSCLLSFLTCPSFITSWELNRDHHFQQFTLLRAYPLLREPCVNSVATLWFPSVYNFQFSYPWKPCSVTVGFQETISPWQRVCKFVSYKRPTCYIHICVYVCLIYWNTGSFVK
jgi:hypothetical protein